MNHISPHTSMFGDLGLSDTELTLIIEVGLLPPA